MFAYKTPQKVIPLILLVIALLCLGKNWDNQNVGSIYQNRDKIYHLKMPDKQMNLSGQK